MFELGLNIENLHVEIKVCLKLGVRDVTFDTENSQIIHWIGRGDLIGVVRAEELDEAWQRRLDNYDWIVFIINHLREHINEIFV